MSRRAAAAVAAAALLALAASTALAAARVAPFHGWYYQLAWYPALVALDALHAVRYGEGPLLDRPRFAVSLWLWSIPAWLLFEAVNFRIANWYYVLASPDPLVRRASAALAFATVLPAILLAHRWMESLRLARRWRGPPFRVGRTLRRLVFVGGLAFAGLALWRPGLFYPLVWGAVTLLLEPWNHRRDPAGSLLGDVAAGRYARPVRLLAAGAVVGLLWEAFNSLAATRWIYTVPGLEELKLFEMPVPGYLGFPVFALDCFVIYRALVNLGVAVPGWDGGGAGEADTGGTTARRGSAAPRLRPLRTAVAALAAAAFSLAVLRGIDRWTVDSLDRGLEGLPGAGEEVVGALRAAGFGSVAEVARATPGGLAGAAGLAPETAATLRNAARLATLRGLGTSNAAALLAAGIESPCRLARADAAAVSAAVRERRDAPRAGRPARVRVWIRAARDACEERE